MIIIRPSKTWGADSGNGFTLIELSIVLVIIGLIVGGVLVGQNLIAAAAVRAQISQIEKYNAAVNTFHGKYGALPGDMNAAAAAQFGFASRGPGPGEGDGNGVLQGNSQANHGTLSNYGDQESSGETVMFWSDLTYANGMNIDLIDGSFTAANPVYTTGIIPATQVGAYFPQAKIGQGNYVYAWSGGLNTGFWGDGDGINYFGLSAITSVGSGYCGGCIISTPALTVQQAYSIDAKIDDGLPQMGNVTTMYFNYAANAPSPYAQWAEGGGQFGLVGNPFVQVTPSPTTCYDNGNGAFYPNKYSLSQNGGAGMNCALSFRFQ